MEYNPDSHVKYGSENRMPDFLYKKNSAVTFLHNILVVELVIFPLFETLFNCGAW
jgi:hypothetical protein